MSQRRTQNGASVPYVEPPVRVVCPSCTLFSSFDGRAFFSLAASGGGRRREAVGGSKAARLGWGSGGRRPGKEGQAPALARCAVLKNPQTGPTHPPPAGRKTRKQDPPTHPTTYDLAFLFRWVG